jgi:hypothetical protein
MGIKYPVLVFSKDDQSVMIFLDEDDLVNWIEVPDIKNQEYLIWDCFGEGLKLLTDKDSVKLEYDDQGESLQDFLKKHTLDKSNKNLSTDLELLLFMFQLVN